MNATSDIRQNIGISTRSGGFLLGLHISAPIQSAVLAAAPDSRPLVRNAVAFDWLLNGLGLLIEKALEPEPEFAYGGSWEYAIAFFTVRDRVSASELVHEYFEISGLLPFIELAFEFEAEGLWLPLLPVDSLDRKFERHLTPECLARIAYLDRGASDDWNEFLSHIDGTVHAQ